MNLSNKHVFICLARKMHLLKMCASFLSVSIYMQNRFSICAHGQLPTQPLASQVWTARPQILPPSSFSLSLSLSFPHLFRSDLENNVPSFTQQYLKLFPCRWFYRGLNRNELRHLRTAIVYHKEQQKIPKILHNAAPLAFLVKKKPSLVSALRNSFS